MSETLRAEVTSLLKDAIISVPGADRDLVEMHLGNALREFTRQSTIWTEHQELRTVAGAAEYALASPCPAALVGWVLAARYDKGELGLWAPPYGQAMQAMQAVDQRTGSPTSIGCPSPGIVHIAPTPDGEYSIHLIVSLIANGITAPLPPNLIELFHDTLLSGTLHRLYGMPGMPFTSSKLAEYHGRKFRAGMVDARIAARRTYASGFQPVGYAQMPAGTITR